jgi:hypothetical protein
MSRIWDMGHHTSISVAIAIDPRITQAKSICAAKHLITPLRTHAIPAHPKRYTC